MCTFFLLLQANGENNNDGSNDNFSWNCGVEGDTSDGGVLDMRYKQMRNYLVALLMAIGTPMIVMGGWSVKPEPP
jgi:pullulanase/glycogen debranching enzyme